MDFENAKCGNKNEIDFIISDKVSTLNDVIIINNINRGGNHRMVA